MDRREILARGFADPKKTKSVGDIPYYETWFVGSLCACQNCGQSFAKDGRLSDHKVIDIMDDEIVIISVTKRHRYRCTKCGNTALSPDLYPPKSKYSSDYLSSAAKTLLDNMDTCIEYDVAKQYGISVGTLSSAVDQLLQRKGRKIRTVQDCDYLYIYPVEFKKQNCCILFGDAHDEELGTILLDILPEHSAVTVLKWISDRLELRKIREMGCALDAAIFTALSCKYPKIDHQVIRELAINYMESFITESKDWTFYEIDNAIQPVIDLMNEESDFNKLYPDIDAFKSKIDAWWAKVLPKIKPHLAPLLENIHECLDGCYSSACKQKVLPKRIERVNQLIEKWQSTRISYEGMVQRLLYDERAMRQDFAITPDYTCERMYISNDNIGRYGAYVDIDALLEIYAQNE